MPPRRRRAVKGGTPPSSTGVGTPSSSVSTSIKNVELETVSLAELEKIVEVEMLSDDASDEVECNIRRLLRKLASKSRSRAVKDVAAADKDGVAADGKEHIAADGNGDAAAPPRLVQGLNLSGEGLLSSNFRTEAADKDDFTVPPRLVQGSLGTTIKWVIEYCGQKLIELWQILIGSLFLLMLI